MEYDYSKKTFLNELNKRIELLSSSKITENIDNSNYNEIMAELSNFGIASENDIVKDEIRKLDKNTIIKILIMAGTNEITADYLASQSDESAYSEIANKINDYIKTYKDVKNNQKSTFNAKLSLYLKYVKLLMNDFNNEKFEDFNELIKVMSEVGLEQEHQNRILEHIGQMNIFKPHDELNELIVNIAVEREKIEKYIEDSQVKEKLANIYATKEMDIELMPTNAEYISKEVGLPEDVANNITVIAICEKELLLELPRAGKSDKQKVIDCAKLAFKEIRRLHEPCVYEAQEIIGNLGIKYHEELENGLTEEKIASYQEIPITEIEKEVNDHDRAISLKELSMYKIMDKTLENIMENLDIGSEEYQKATNVLSDLIESYKNIETKRVEIKRVN